MTPHRLLCAFLLLALASCTSNAPSSLSSSQRAEIAQIDAALKLVGEKHFAEAEVIIQPVIHAKDFGRLPSAEQYRALLTAARLAFTLKEPKLEYESRVRLLALPEATAEDRMSRVNAANRLQDTGEVLIGLKVFVERDPGRLDYSTQPFIIRALRDGKKQLPRGSTLPLLQALYGAHWKLRWNEEPSFAWSDLTLLLLERNRLPEAIDVATHITDEYGLISMRADRRFDAVVGANPEHFDVDAAAKRGLRDFQVAVAIAPQSLMPKLIVIDRLIEQQHYAGALAAADGTLAEIRSNSDPKQWYEDFNDNYAWILDSRSRALRRLGRWDEGLDQLAAASHVLDASGGNVSQVINLGELYCHLGQPREALGSLDRLGTDISPYGLMQAANVRLDAAIQLGDTGQTERWLGFIREHRADAPRAYQDALLMVNDVDTAAKWLIERLEDKDQRAATLLTVQDYAIPLLTSKQAELSKRTQGLIARADVQAEIQRVGRVESYKIEGLGQ
jgi:tetratricopeptide (TPR) repeat protein